MIRSTAKERLPPRAGSFINLNNGLVLSGTGAVSLGSGALTVNDTALRHQWRIPFRVEAVRRQYRQRCVHPLGRSQHDFRQPLSWIQRARQRNLHPQRDRTIVRRLRVPGLFGHRLRLYPVGRNQQHHLLLLRPLSSGTTLAPAARTTSAAPGSCKCMAPRRTSTLVARQRRLQPVRRNEFDSHRRPVCRLLRVAVGTYNLSGPGQSSVAGEEYVGFSGAGDLHPIRRYQQCHLPLSWEQLRRQRNLQPQRQRAVFHREVRIHWCFRQPVPSPSPEEPIRLTIILRGSVYVGCNTGAAARTTSATAHLSVADRVRGLRRHGELHAVRRNEHARFALSGLQFRHWRDLHP